MAHRAGPLEWESRSGFDAPVSDSARFHGARAEFNPTMETCFAISCHTKDGAYRFEACSKDLPGLVGEGPSSRVRGFRKMVGIPGQGSFLQGPCLPGLSGEGQAYQCDEMP